ncbi:MAG: tyrosine-type recombinase/integrase [Spirochaetes bacterium]|uniref:Tyrosine-type recombinase/integrase n=1 Tax=Candidatus Ornithospirochaeta stercoripullorum TaxID=2840899 RepID=A0A9D9H4H8_9SPIO|nr:tyrosine-type recombinase/integrase [Candidatus Ornithospirochaeta stercoripullorum]
MRNPFQLYTRKLISKCGHTKKVFYVRYWDYEKEKYFCTKSINELSFKLGDRSGKNIKTEVRASAIAQEALDKGLIFENNTSTKVSFEAYARKVWDYDTSDYIRRKNQEKAGSISRIYADGQLGWLIREVFPYISKGMDIREFTASVAENIKDRMIDEHKASSSINKTLQAIRTPLNEAYRTGVITVEIAPRIKNIAITHKKKGILTSLETKKLETYLNETTEKGSYDRNRFLAIALAIHTGMREGEIRALRDSDISITENGEIAVIKITHAYNDKDKLKAPKGKESRIVPVPINLANEIIQYSRLSEGTEYIFHSAAKVSVPVSPQLMSKWFKEALENIGISKEEQSMRNLSFHSLRHGFVTATRDAGLSGTERKALSGHKSEAMLDHYTKETVEHLKRTIEQIENVIPFNF